MCTLVDKINHKIKSPRRLSPGGGQRRGKEREMVDGVRIKRDLYRVELCVRERKLGLCLCFVTLCFLMPCVNICCVTE